MSVQQPKLLDLVRQRIRYKHMSYRTEQAYCGWIKRYVIYLGFGYFPHLMNPLIQGQEFLDGIIFIIKVCNAHSKLLCSKQISQNLLHCIL